jgi:peptidylprolyl isomerase
MPPMQRLFLIIAACLALVVAGCGSDSSSSTTSGGSETTAQSPSEEGSTAEEASEEEEAAEEIPEVTVPKGPPPKELVIEDKKKGSGKTAKAGDEVSVNYIGVVYKTKEQFDANWNSGEPFTFTLGAKEVIPGWDKGVQGMKVGGLRKLIIPPALAYGNQGIFPSIPANSTLIFLVELLAVK